MMVVDTEFGYTYGNYRPAEEGKTYWRIAQYLFPFYSMPPTGILGERIAVIAIVPVDDSHSMRWQMGVARDPNSPRQFGAIGPAYAPHPEHAGYEEGDSGFMGKWRLKLKKENDYMIDRDRQRTMESWTGIWGIGDQDHAMVESMGDIYDRTKEHLATSDMGVIRLRRLLLNAMKALREDGTVPLGVDNPEVYKVRSGGIVLPNGIDGVEATRDLQRARVEKTAIPAAVHLENHGV